MSADVVVLLGSRFEQLEHHGTRWRALLVRWVADPRVATLTVVDFPRFGRRGGSRAIPSWLPGCSALDLRVPGRVAGGAADGLGWWLAGRAVSRRLPGRASERLVVAATPLSVPLMRHLPAKVHAFDAVDDWRALPSAVAARRRVVAGYEEAAHADRVTAVSPVLADRLRIDFGAEAVVFGNGVDAGPPPELHADLRRRLPTEPFAVYVGVVQQRVDLGLLTAVAAHVPVVVAGPAHGDAARQLELAAGVTWLGPVAAAQVRPLVAQAAVGLLPHDVDALTLSMAPMKLLEYVAAGLPVVSTRLPGLDGLPGVQAVDRASFVSAVVAAAKAVPGPPDPAWVARHDWDGIADGLLTHLLAR